jgi:hypothetical protein
MLNIVDQMLQVPVQPPSLTNACFDFMDLLESKSLWFYAFKIALAVTTNMIILFSLNVCFHYMNICFQYKAPN